MAEPTTDTANASIDRRKDVDDKPLSSKFWLGEIKAAQKRSSAWVERADEVVKRYRDERNMERNANSNRRTNILWSNTETLKSALFQGLGKPDVRRRHQKQGSQEDRVARQAALVLERGLAYCADSYDAEEQLDACVEDQLLPGRGTAWIEYEVDVDDYGGANADTSEEPAVDDQPELAEGTATTYAPQIKAQKVQFVHVYWRDFLTSSGRKWSDVWWVAREHDYSRDELTKYWPKHAKDIPLGVEISGYESDSRTRSKKEDEDTFKRARVWEIWDKSKKQRVYIAEGYKHVLQMTPDPYKLKDFFPTVSPLYGVKNTSSLEAIPEYTLYQDQAEELDEIQTRLTKLTKALKRRGVYDASAEGPDNQLSKLANADDNQFLPYRNFAVLAEKGGLENVFQAEDLTKMVEVIDKLGVRQGTLVQQIYEITGISDIMRGASNANETATAQRIKGQFGSMRLQRRQKKVQVFIRNLYRLKAEIMAEHFTREQLQEMSGIDMPLKAEQAMAQQALDLMQMQMQKVQQAQQMAQQGQGAVQVPQMPQIDPKITKRLIDTVKAVAWEDIEAVLRSDQRRGYRVDIETEALAQVDDETEKTQRMEFMTAMQSFMEVTMPAIQQFPALAPLAKETASFVVGTFNAGRTMEEAFEDAFTQIEEMAKAQAAKGPPPNPDMVKAQADAEAAKMEMASKKEELQVKSVESDKDRQLKLAEMQHQRSLQADDHAHQVELERMKQQNAMLLDEVRRNHEQQLKANEFDQQRQLAEVNASVEREKTDWERHFKTNETATNFDLEERKMLQADKHHEAGVGLEREKHGSSLNFEKQKHGAEVMSAPIEDGGQQSSIGAVISALKDTLTQQAQTFTEALRSMQQQNAEAVKVAMAPREMVKDPKTGAKRVQIVMQ